MIMRAFENELCMHWLKKPCSLMKYSWASHLFYCVKISLGNTCNGTLLYIKKTPHAWWCKVLRLIQDMVRSLSSHGRQGNYIQDLFGPRQTDSALLSSRGLIQFCHPQDGHEFVSLSFPRTSCQLNTPSPTSSRNLVPWMGRTNFLPTASSPLPALPTLSTKAQANRWWPQQARTAEPLPPCRTSAPAQACSPWRAAALLTLMPEDSPRFLAPLL